MIYDLPTYSLKYLKKLREEKRIEEGGRTRNLVGNGKYKYRYTPL